MCDTPGAASCDCSTSTDSTATTTEITADSAVTATYTVTGMTCGHCVSSVSIEVGKLPGVTGVEVDLDSGAVMVTSERPVEAAEIRAAVDEAGYELVG